MLKAGDLNHSVVLENPSTTPDGDGGFTQTWTALSPSPVWASVLPATSGRMERLVGSTVEAGATHLVEMRYHPGVTIKTRVTLGSRHLQVINVQNVDERSEVTRLTCVEILS